MDFVGANAKLWSILKSVLSSYVVTVVLLLILSVLMYQLKWGAMQAAGGVLLIYAVSCLLGGFLLGRKMGSRRLLWGMFSGLLYLVLLLIVSACTQGGITGDMKAIGIAAAVCVIGGAVGGVLS